MTYSRELLKSQIIAMQKEVLDNAKPMQELAIRAMQEDWDDDQLREETVKLLKNKLIDFAKDYGYYADRVCDLVEQMLPLEAMARK